MGVIDYYDSVFPNVLVQQPKVVKPVEEVYHSVPFLEDAKLVTLAEFNPITRDVITAHRLKDYRRKCFNIVLLPEIEIMFDKVLEGSDYWSELLHDEGAYT